jgi:hypothetical protein
MGTATFSFRFVRMVAVVLAAAARYLAVSPFRIIGGWLIRAQRFLGVLVGRARTALADACRRLL